MSYQDQHLLGGGTKPLDRSYPPQYYQHPYDVSYDSNHRAEGGYHDRQGYSTNNSHYKRSGSRMYLPRTTWTWCFLLTVFLQTAVALALEGFVFAKFEIDLSQNNNQTSSSTTTTSTTSDATTTTSTTSTTSPGTQSRTIPTYLSVYIFGFLYQIVLTWDALRLKNTIQVIGLCLYNVGMLVYSAIQKDQISEAVTFLHNNGQISEDFWTTSEPFLIAVPCVIGFCTLVMAGIAWKLYDEFAWTIYKHISADLRMKRRYLTYQIYIALLKFDFFFFLGFSVQFVVIVVNNTDPEFYLTIAAVPITILILILAAYWTRRESVVGMVIIIILYFAALAYFLFKLVRMYDTDNPGLVEAYTPARRSLTTFAVITILLLIVTIVVAGMCTHNFNKGLKPHIAKRKVPDADKKSYGRQTEMPAIGSHHPTNSRMEID